MHVIMHSVQALTQKIINLTQPYAEDMQQGPPIAKVYMNRYDKDSQNI